MSPKTRAAYAIAVTLCIGALIGALGHGAYLSSQSKKVRSTPPAQFFVAELERAIQPNESQRDAISKILSMRSEQIAAIMERHLAEVAAIMDSTKNEVTPLLNQEQQHRLNEHLERWMMGPPKMPTRETLAEGMKERLGLTSEQFEKVQKLLESSQKEIADLFASRRDDPKVLHDSVTSIMFATEAKIKSLMTPQQQKEFEALRRNEPFRFGPGEFPPRKREHEKE
jgi:hypothetical protein